MSPILTHTTLLTALAILVRGCGVTLRVAEAPGLRLAGWLVCMGATWAAAGAAGAFSPLWPVLVVGLLGGLLEWRERSGGFFAAGDAAAVVILLVTSTPRLDWQTVVVFLLALSLGWVAIEAAVRSVGPGLRVAGGVAGAAAAGLLVAAAGMPGGGLRLLPLPSMLPHLAVTSQCEGERVVLESGTVGWLEGAAAGTARDAAGRGGEGVVAALHLHGNHRAGSRQPAACVLRRALVHAGFLTLAVDHPGFGHSPAPSPGASVEAWDFTPAHAEAYDWLAARPGVRQVVVIGHSMGVRDALRLASARPEIPLFFLFAGSLGDPTQRDDYWYLRFHVERGLSDSVPRWKWREIEETHYDAERAVRALSPDHGFAVFATAEHEWDDVTAGRELLFELIPGPKARWHLRHASHYFNAFEVAGIILGDARVARRVAAGLRSRTAEALEPLP